MRRFATLIAAILIVAGCASGATTSPSPAPATESPGAPSTSPGSTCSGSDCGPVETPAAVSARVTFDGTSCAYTGPALIAVPAILTIEFAPTKESYALSLDLVLASTSRADVDRVNADESYGPRPGNVRPEFMIPGALERIMGTMTYDKELQVATTAAGTYDQLAITCIETPWGSGVPAGQPEGRHTGALIQLVAGEATTSDGSTGSPADTQAISHVTGTLLGGWHRPERTGGCAIVSGRNRAFLDCFGVVDDARVSGKYGISAVDGTSASGYGELAIQPAHGGMWRGDWFAESATWPLEVAQLPVLRDGAENDPGLSVPAPAEITMDWARVTGEGKYEGLTYVLTIVDGAIDGWVFGSPPSSSVGG